MGPLVAGGSVARSRPVPSARALHPGAWWAWALACAVVAARTTNPALLGLTIAIVGLTVVARRGDAPWALAFRLYVGLAVFVVVVRIGFRILFSAAGPTVLLPLPVLRLPGPLSSVQLLGPVSAEALVLAGESALQLAAMILAVGAANSLANPKRLLAAVPGALYEWGTVVVIALTVFPQLAESVGRVRRARQLRCDAGRGLHLIRDIALPVLSDALDRSLLLAGAMDSRGYGRSAQIPAASRRATAALLLVATLAIAIGAYGLLDTGGTPLWLGAPMVAGGVLAGLVGLRLSGRRVVRTRYRPDRLGLTEWLILACAVVAVLLSFLLGHLQVGVAYPPVQPLGWPAVSWLGLASVLVLAAPVLVTPAPQLASGPARPSPAARLSPAAGPLADGSRGSGPARPGESAGAAPVAPLPVASLPKTPSSGFSPAGPDSPAQRYRDLVRAEGRPAPAGGAATALGGAA